MACSNCGRVSCDCGDSGYKSQPIHKQLLGVEKRAERYRWKLYAVEALLGQAIEIVSRIKSDKAQEVHNLLSSARDKCSIYT